MQPFTRLGVIKHCRFLNKHYSDNTRFLTVFTEKLIENTEVEWKILNLSGDRVMISGHQQLSLLCVCVCSCRCNQPHLDSAVHFCTQFMYFYASVSLVPMGVRACFLFSIFVCVVCQSYDALYENNSNNMNRNAFLSSEP